MTRRKIQPTDGNGNPLPTRTPEGYRQVTDGDGNPVGGLPGNEGTVGLPQPDGNQARTGKAPKNEVKVG